MSEFSIQKAASEADIDATRRLFQDYATWLETDHGISLEFQGIDAELAGLPGKYAPPGGQIYLALRAGEALGCAAFRPFEGKVCEIKRLYVSPKARGHALGQKLVETVLQGARDAGYVRAVLDTADFMGQAQRVYESFGFTDIPKYYENPVAGVRYMGGDL